MAILVASSSMVLSAYASSMTGGESGAYLRYPVGATALAMGGAYSAAPSSLLPWWNPAKIAHLRKKSADFGMGIRSLGQTDGYASFAFRVPPRAGMGFFLLYRGDPFLDELYDDNEQKLESAAYTTFTGKIAFSYYLTKRLTAGLNFSVNYSKLPSGYIDGKVNYSSATSFGSFDFALLYRYSERLSFAALLREAGTTLNWNFESSYSYNIPNEDNLLPSLLLAGSYADSLYGKPFIWNTDLRWYLFEGEGELFERPQAVLYSGVEWHYWEHVYLRAGLGDLLLNSDIVTDGRYLDDFSFRFCGGVSFDLYNVKKGMRLNYGFATDKVWAGVDQQLDVTVSF